ncbi:MAG: hypothetical protein FWF51_08250 [Chitinivibrionia bacterium]|nr:hypothetical protein [Chitinivibrionia bacterium]
MDASLPKITVISGNNPFEMRNAKGAFIEKAEKLYPNNTSEFFDGSGEISFWEFIQKISMHSMFGDIKFLFINHAESKEVLADKQHYDAFEKTLQVCIDEVFIFVEVDTDDGEKTSKNYFSAAELSQNLKELSQKIGGSFTQFSAIREYEIPKWIVGKVREYYDRYISEKAAELLVNLSGADLGVLDGELRKIDAALSPKKEITEADIYELTGNNRQITAQEIAQFIGLRKWNNEASAAFDNFAEKDGQFAIPFLSELYRRFWILLKIRLFAEENRAKVNTYFDKKIDRETKNAVVFEIGVACGVLKETQKNAVFPMMIKPQLIEQARNYSKEQFYEIIKIIAQYDRDIKNGEIKLDFQKEAIKDLCRKIASMEN